MGYELPSPGDNVIGSPIVEALTSSALHSFHMMDLDTDVGAPGGRMIKPTSTLTQAIAHHKPI
jgi:hypothetical protein